MSTKRMALIGSGGPEYAKHVLDTWKEKGKCYDAWTFRVRDEALPILKNQFDKDGSFDIYYFLSKKKGGHGTIQYKASIVDFHTGKKSSPSPDSSITPEGWTVDENSPYRTWFLVNHMSKLASPIDLTQFRDYFKNSTKKPQQLMNSFAYVEDIELLSTPSREVFLKNSKSLSTEIELLEKELEEIIAEDPALLGLGELELVGRQKSVEFGRLDLLFKRKNDDQLILIELKKGDLQDRDIVQLKNYWASNDFSDLNIKGILVCGGITEKQKKVIELDKKHGYDIEVRTYDCILQLNKTI